MELSITEITPTRKSVSVGLSAAEIAVERSGVVNQIRQQARIPGFRPGKAPDQMLLKRFSQEILSETRQQVLRNAWRKAAAEGSFKTVGIIEVDDSSAVLDGSVDASLKFTVDVEPEFALPSYHAIPVVIGSTTPTEAEVDQYIEGLRSQHADYDIVELPADKGSYVKCSYEGTIAGEPVESIAPGHPMYAAQKNTWEEAGAENSPGVAAVIAALVGMAAGDTKEVTTTFPDDFGVEDLQGKEVSYKIEVHEVRQKVLPELDEELLKTLDVDSLDTLRATIVDNLTRRKTDHNAKLVHRQVIEALNSSVDFPLPESIVESRREIILLDYMKDQMLRGASEEDFEKRKEELFAAADAAARKQVKIDILLERIAREEKVELTDADFARYVYDRASRTRQKPEAIVKELRKNEKELAEVRRSLLLGRTAAMIAENSDRREVPDSELQALFAPQSA